MKYDVVVIGAGPGGYVAAIRAAQLGLKSAVFERGKVGGVCLNHGCIPTKTLLKSAKVYRYVKEASSYGIEVGGGSINVETLMKRKEDVVRQLIKGVEYLLKANGVDIVRGNARLINPKCVEVDGVKYDAEYIILAMGSKAALPPIPGIERAKTSEELLNIRKLPKSISIIGGGVIGVEFAMMLAEFDVDVTIVEMLPSIINAADEDVVMEAEKILKKLGVNIVCSAKVTSIGTSNLMYEKDGRICELEQEEILISTGRSPNVDTDILDEIGIIHDKGWIKTDEHLRTNIPNIYCIGDLNGNIMLAHKASVEGITAAHCISGEDRRMSYDRIPQCIYTSPEIAWIGINERDAINRGIAFKKSVFPMTANGKSLVEGDTRGFVKIISDEETMEVLGVHIVSMNASEMISEISAIMSLEGTVDSIPLAVHPHPSISEAIMETAEACTFKAIHNL